MAGKQAKVLFDPQVKDLLIFAGHSRNPLRNRVLVMLSVKAGLRAGEIAKLTWAMVLGSSGEIAAAIELRDHAAKRGSGRLIPIHPDLRKALDVWRTASVTVGAVIRSERGGSMTPVSIVNWFALAYRSRRGRRAVYFISSRGSRRRHRAQAVAIIWPSRSRIMTWPKMRQRRRRRNRLSYRRSRISLIVPCRMTRWE
jgi:integrase